MIFLIASLYIDYRYIFIYIGILEPLQELRARLGACKTKLRPTVVYTTDRSKAILLWR